MHLTQIDVSRLLLQDELGMRQGHRVGEKACPLLKSLDSCKYKVTYTKYVKLKWELIFTMS